ncbi:MAG TPA: sigma-70 family RNA polymerase sigma factor [Lacipirellula sp.]
MPNDTRDPLEFSELLRLSRSRVFGHLLALVQNLADAEDLYQQTALLLWEKFDEYERGTDFGSWASTVAHFTALNFLRRQSRRRVLFSKAAIDRLLKIQSELRTSDCCARSEALVNCLKGLSDRDRRLLRLRYEADHSMSEIAERESSSVGAMYTALSRIRKALIACIERRMGMEAGA